MTWLGACCPVDKVLNEAVLLGTVLVIVNSNSLRTMNGFCAEPSAVAVSVAPPGPVPGGNAPLPGKAVMQRATLGRASSRY